VSEDAPAKLFPEDITGRVVHEVEEWIYIPLPTLDGMNNWSWRFGVKLQITSYWMPEVEVVLHRFYWRRLVEQRQGPGDNGRWESSTPTGEEYHRVMEFVGSLLIEEFGGSQLDYAFIHHFGYMLNNLGVAVRRSVKAYEDVLARGRKALDAEVIAGAVRVTADDEKVS